MVKFKNDPLLLTGGGNVGSYIMTESVEAVDLSIRKKVRFIELDLLKTIDGKIVAFHDWTSWHRRTGTEGQGERVIFSEFSNRLIDSLFTPMTFLNIDSMFTANPSVNFVTDRTSNISVLDELLSLDVRKRTYVECFSYLDYKAIKASGTYHPLISGYMKENDIKKIILEEWDVNDKCIVLSISKYNEYKEKYPWLQFISPFCYAVYSAPDERYADSLMKSDSRIRFVYVNSFD